MSEQSTESNDPVRRCARVFAHPGHAYRTEGSTRLFWCKGSPALDDRKSVIPPALSPKEGQ